jgi:hypothetical protein
VDSDPTVRVVGWPQPVGSNRARNRKKTVSSFLISTTALRRESFPISHPIPNYSIYSADQHRHGWRLDDASCRRRLHPSRARCILAAGGRILAVGDGVVMVGSSFLAAVAASPRRLLLPRSGGCSIHSRVAGFISSPPCIRIASPVTSTAM